MTQGALQVFISHVEEDGVIALALKSYLEQIFLDSAVFVSGRDLSGGEVWFEELRRRLDSATAIVALTSTYSKDSRWVFFESGAGFTRKCTIPVAIEPLTVDSLGAPFTLLHARTLERKGIEALTNDLARLAGFRQPSRYPGLDELLASIQEFLTARASPKVESVPSAKASAAAVVEKEDAELRGRLDALKSKARDLVIRALQTRSAPFDLPPSSEMNKMKLDDLFELAEAVGVSLPFYGRMAIGIFLVPPPNIPAWKRMNEQKKMEGLEREWTEFERSLDKSTSK